MTQISQMAHEIAEIPDAAARCLSQNRSEMAAIGAELRRADPAHVITVARGSSDHAAHYVAYAGTIITGLPVASMGPSVVSVYGAKIRADRALVLAISQSGQSRDIVQLADTLRNAGGLTIALTNQLDNQLAHNADHAVDIKAGPEQAVAATKSFVSSVITGLMLLGHWAQDDALLDGLERLPDRLDRARRLDWQAFADHIADVDRLTVLARGPALGLAYEMTLKMMEVCGIAGQAYSAAEVLHGPSALMRDGAPVFAFGTEDAGADSLRSTVDTLRRQGARCLSTLEPGVEMLPRDHDLLDPLAHMPAFYLIAEAEARRRGNDPDRPAFLKKETDTL